VSKLVAAPIVLSLALAGCGDDLPAMDLGFVCEASAAQALLGAPLLFSPTANGFGISAALAAGDPETLRLRVRAVGAGAWIDPGPPTVRATDLAEWTVAGLAPGSRYEYEVVGCSPGGGGVLHADTAVTQRAPGASFTFALFSDTHIGADLSYGNQGDAGIMSAVDRDVATAAPDFLVNLGDMLDYHQFGFNIPPPDASVARQAYLNYRRTLANLSGATSHFPVLGGWDSENGCNTAEEIERSRSQRLLYLPSPGPTTYAEGGSPFEDYYAFTWGDALFIVLNVYTYTPTCHLLYEYPGLADDWTLGQAQLDWLRQTLQGATSKWKFLFIHHPVGGNAGDDVNSAYGRGGGRAAHVGEQETVHELMQQFGVQIFFYGHDHVFTDMVVDNIHYTLPGSAGAIWMFSMAETGYDTSWPYSGWARVDVTPDDVHVQFFPVGTTQPLFDYTVR
jgi:Calcineurin-like phosphoesterase